MQTPKVLTKGRKETLGYSCLLPDTGAVDGQVIIVAAVLSHSMRSSPETSQHANVAKCCLRRTAGQARLDDLAVRAEKLPGRTLLTLT
jgi:hypothetical protein